MSQLFTYFATPDLGLGQDRFTLFIPSKIASVESLFAVYYEGMMLPGYFGFNFNALFDCLTSIDWIDRNEFRIMHFDLPLIEETALREYLRLLEDTVTEYRGREVRRFTVCFPDDCTKRIELLLSQGQPWE